MTPQTDTLGARIKLAMQVYAAHHGGNTSPKEFGEVVARELKMQSTISAETVFAWMNDTSAPSFATAMIIARFGGYTTDTQMRWLAYGNEHNIHALNEQDYDRFHKRAKVRVGAYVV